MPKERTEKREVTREEFDNLEAFVRKLHEKQERIAANWKVFAKRNVGSDAEDGKMKGSIRLCVLIGLFVLSFGVAAVMGTDSTLDANAIVRYGDATDHYSVQIGSASGESFINITGFLSCDGLTNTGASVSTGASTYSNANNVFYGTLNNCTGTNGSWGAPTIRGGTSTNHAAGALTVYGVTGTNGTWGNLTLYGGTSTNQTAGALTVKGVTGTNGTWGALTLYGGTSTNHAAGALTINGGTANNLTVNSGGGTFAAATTISNASSVFFGVVNNSTITNTTIGAPSINGGSYTNGILGAGTVAGGIVTNASFGAGTVGNSTVTGCTITNSTIDGHTLPMILGVGITNGWIQCGTVTATDLDGHFGVAFGNATVYVAMWWTDGGAVGTPGTNGAIQIVSTTATNFIFSSPVSTAGMVTNGAFIAIGQKP